MVCCHLGFEEFTLLKPGRLRKMQDSELKWYYSRARGVRVCLQPLLGDVASWDQEDEVTGQSLLAQCSCWEVLEKPCCTSCKENHPSPKTLRGGLSRGSPASGCFTTSWPPFRLRPGNALIVPGGDFWLRALAYCWEQSCRSLKLLRLAPVACEASCWGFRSGVVRVGCSLLSAVASALGDVVAGRPAFRLKSGTAFVVFLWRFWLRVTVWGWSAACSQLWPHQPLAPGPDPFPVRGSLPCHAGDQKHLLLWKRDLTHLYFPEQELGSPNTTSSP